MLEIKLAQLLANGLRRKSLSTCSKWAENYIRMGKPFPGKLTFKYHPWTREMHDSRASRNVGKKAAQVGYSVVAINRSFYRISQLRESVLYLLPSKNPDASDFSATKFDPALEMSPHLADLFTDVRNAGTKRSGSAILYIRGSNSRKGLKSISVSEVFCDEFDEMPDHTIPLAQERMSGQSQKSLFILSTPRFPGLGIDLQFSETTKEHFFFECPRCSQQIELLHENLVVTADDWHDPKIKESYVQCNLCKGVLFVEDTSPDEKAEILKSGLWVPTGHKDYDDRGFYINQLYAPNLRPSEMATAYLKSLTNQSAEQEYHNSKMGNAHEVAGARISLDTIQDCLSPSGRRKGVVPGKLVTMGVDVGRWLHYEIVAWDIERVGNDINLMSKAILIDEGKKADFSELDELMRRWQILMCVIDIQPETRQALNFAKRFWGHVKLCRYSNEISDRSVGVDADSNFIVKVDRTTWLDLSLGRFHYKTIDLPTDLSLEYRSHVRNIARIYKEDRDGNQVGRYVSNGDDHFAHARTYNEIALPLAASITTNRDIEAFL